MSTESGTVQTVSGERLRVMVEVALAVALAAVLHFVRIVTLPQGGSVCLEMLPILVVAFRRGVGVGIIAGLLYSPVLYAIEPFFVHPVQAVLDYPLAFGLLGLAGLFNKDDGLARVTAGTVLASVARLTAHFISGIVFFASYSEGVSPWSLKAVGVTVPASWVYSLSYNGSYVMISTLVVLALIYPILKGLKAAGV